MVLIDPKQPMVLVSGETAAWLERHGNLIGLRMRARGSNPRVAEELGHIKQAAVAFASALLPEAEAPDPEVLADSERWMGTTAAADLIGVTDSAVRLACRQGRLTGRQVGGCWEVTREEAKRYARDRNGR